NNHCINNYNNCSIKITEIEYLFLNYIIGGIKMIAVYIKVSSATQVKDGYSLKTQKERLTSFCKANGWDDYKFYVEEGRSPKNDKRPEYQKMMKDVKDKKVNTVLVYRLDKIGRASCRERVKM